MKRLIKDKIIDKINEQDVFYRTISFTYFSVLGTSASKIWENEIKKA